jgi:hypothetical protein
MTQQLRVTRKVDFTGAVKVGFPVSSFAGIGIGKVLFVDFGNGSDAFSGLDPNYAKNTIQAAIDACTNWYNDYIFVMRRATSDVTTTTPILMNKHCVHLVGLCSHSSQGASIRLVHTNETDNVLEFPLDTGYHCEVAGFGFGGGTTGKGGIGMPDASAQGVGAWIHHCNFGSLLTKGTPDYGIHNDNQGAECFAWTIEDCTFYGSGDNSKGLISVNAINIVHSPGILTASKNVLIQRNIFMGIPGVAINLDGVAGGMILNNTFKMDADTAGSAITIGNDCRGCWIDGNSANFGSADAATGPPWLNNGSADQNSFGCNYEGGTEGYPAT